MHGRDRQRQAKDQRGFPPLESGMETSKNQEEKIEAKCASHQETGKRDEHGNGNQAY